MVSTNIAVVGAGSAGTTLLKRLVRKLPAAGQTWFHIDVFDSRRQPGPGVAYSEGADSLLLNRTAERMYAYYDKDFYYWLVQKHGAIFDAEALAKQYLPRRYFGEYLREVFDRSVKEAGLRNITVEFHREEITDVLHSDKKFKLRLHDQRDRYYDFLFVTTGNDINIDCYNLKEAPGFFHSPFPLSQFQSLIKRKDVDIGVIGTRLCAVDVANYLVQCNGSLKVDLLSRSGKLPRTARPMDPHRLTVLTEQAIMRRVHANEGWITLAQAKELLAEEVRAHCSAPAWVEQLFIDPDSLQTDCENHWKLYNILAATNYVSSLVWRYLPDREKSIFLKRYSSKWLHFRIGIPWESYQAIKTRMDRGEIGVNGGVANVKALSRGFEVHFSNGSVKRYDTIINATGIKRNIDDRSSLFSRALLLKRLFQANPFGGIKVCPDTCSARVRGVDNRRLKVIGQLTCGDFYMVNNADILSKQVQLAVDDMCEQLLRTKAAIWC